MRTRSVRSKPASSIESRPAVRALPSALHAASVVRWIDDSTSIEARVGTHIVVATLDPSVDRAVIDTALRNGERVLIQPEGDGWVALGTLRTRATPGVDEMEEVRIKAKRLRLEGEDEVQLVTAAASLVLRVSGAVETIAREITTRATGVHKLIGRVLHLN